MTAGTAHIAFAGGGLVVPCASLYERQLLREHVLAGVHHQRWLQVSVDGAHWRVEASDRRHPLLCDQCGSPIHHAVCHASGQPTTYCVTCALRA